MRVSGGSARRWCLLRRSGNISGMAGRARPGYRMDDEYTNTGILRRAAAHAPLRAWDWPIAAQRPRPRGRTTRPSLIRVLWRDNVRHFPRRAPRGASTHTRKETGMGHRLSKIATRTGDAGTTGLGDGTRTGKDSLRIAAIGDVDELNCHVGVLLTEALPDNVRAALLHIQHDLFDLGGELSIPGYTLLKPEQVAQLDTWLADYNANLPRLAEFILPGGSRAAAQAHVCRTVCRRAERSLVALGAAEALNEAPRQYLNRLSDLMFVLARVLNRAGGGSDVLWQRDRQAT
ncbi:ATP--cobalamin adenosyltransferase [Ralstonia pickettii DTP0602]|nr:ATP--cobalamin adenosyltransferase [Ralstonia pickettii DTP0602]